MKLMNEKVALVTGASSGIGTAVACMLADHGYRVMAAGRDAGRTEKLREYSPGIETWTGDIGSAEACAELTSHCIKKLGRLDLLVNNAGIYFPANAENTSDEIWTSTIAVNLNAVFFLSREAMPHIREARGVILNIASDWGLAGGKDAVAYCASKGGVVMMTRAMALDHAHEGIRINAVCPGDVETPMLYDEGVARGVDADEALRQAAEMSPTGRVTSATEVASLVLFLASDAAAQINGAAIPIDGGNTA
jgi:meso-butanediol dehydrogenase / (S,S)-butanediol dehydrogenase / diacetyl reductase